MHIDKNNSTGSQLGGGYFVILYNAEKSFIRVGTITGISEKDLSFTYLEDDKKYEGPLFLIILRQKEITPLLGGISCTVLYDEPVYTDSNGLFQIRRCGVQFKELSENQEEQLREFTQRITPGASPLYPP